jgi:hypothetical protein
VDDRGHEAIVRTAKSQAGHVGRVGMERNKYRMLERKSLGKDPAV